MPLRSHIYDLKDLNKPQRVKNERELKEALKNAQPGDVVELNDGDYELRTWAITCNGSEKRPIVIRAGQNRNGAVIRGESTEVTLSGIWVYLEGLRFDESTLLFRHGGQGKGQCRVTRCKFENTDRRGGVIEIRDSSENRIDHCEFNQIKWRGLAINPNNPSYDDEEAIKNTNLQYNLIDYNYFHDFPYYANNGHEPMNLGREQLASLVPCFTTVEYNLFENVPSNEEVISVKSSDNTVQFNTFKNNFEKDVRHGQLNLRHGTRNRVLGNTLIDMEWINARGNDHQILGNRVLTRKSSGNISRIRVSKGNVYNTPARGKAARIRMADTRPGSVV